VAGRIRGNTYKEGSKQILWPPSQCCQKENTGYLADSHAVRNSTMMTANSLISGCTNDILIKHKISSHSAAQEFPTIYGTRRLIIFFIRAHQHFLS
jgi:hypothetical protein